MSRTPPPFDPAELGRIPSEVMGRYDKPGPRYTSYPTAPVWNDDYSEADYERALARSRERGSPLSIYTHIPFCESLCVYCGCNVVVTRRRERAQWYLELVETEIDRLAERLGAGDRETNQVAWGGGTPTYLAPEQILRLMAHIRSRFPFTTDAELAIEVDPRVTTHDHVQAIAEAGFNRISMGVQDFNIEVQEEIHRVQSFEKTAELIGWCRDAGLESVNVDLVYGLPLQNLENFEHTIDCVFELSPDRISAFSYAHVPWLKPQQKKFRDETMLTGMEKFALFTRLVERLCGGGYEFIGMDHFAKPDNELAVAQRTGGLWRNFQGFTTKSGTDLVGTGMTSIASLDDAFAQSEKGLTEYQQRIESGGLTTVRGMDLSDDDRLRRDVIQDIMCTYRFDPERTSQQFGIDAETYFAEALAALAPMEADGIIVREGTGFALTSRGRVFVRNVCMAFDAHLDSKPGDKPVFSRTI